MTRGGGLTASYASGDVDREIVRMLWTFHFATPDQLSRLVCHGSTQGVRRRLARALERLMGMQMVWREARRSLPGYRGHSDGRLSGGWYYGLTEMGRAWAAARMPELQVLHCITREGYLSQAERRTITHSVDCTEYCTRMIEYLRDHPLTLGMFFETESTVLGAHLRIDCLIRLRLYRRTPAGSGAAAALPPWHVPWLPTLRVPTVAGALDATFALEIDEGSETLPILEGKARNYRRTFSQGVPGGQRLVGAGSQTPAAPVVHWQKVLCATDAGDDIAAQAPYFPIPVFVLTSDQRLANVWEAWRQGWPGAEVRMTTWAHLHRARSVLSAPYLNQQRQWVDLLGNGLAG